jgi:hypothetical protein
MQQKRYCWKRGFSTVVLAERLQGKQMGQPSQLCTGGCERGTVGSELEASWKGAAIIEDFEESALLEAVTRERPVKT